MMNPVKSPQEGDDVIGAMPKVGDEVHHHGRNRDLDPDRSIDPSQNSESVLRGEARHSEAASSAHERGREGPAKPQQEIQANASVRSRVRRKALGRERNAHCSHECAHTDEL
jgi:hypothetical protein